MAYLIYSNCIGTFVFENGKLIEEILFSSSEALEADKLLEKNNELINNQLKSELKSEKKLISKYKGAKIIRGEKCPTQVLEFFNSPKYLEQIRNKTLIITKRKVAEALKEDQLIVQAINSVDELDKVINSLAKRLREWYELYNPEFSNSIESHEKFSELITKKTKKELLKEVGIDEKESMGAEFEKKDLQPVLELAGQINTLYAFKKKQTEYIEKRMFELLPNVNAICGAMIGAKLLAIAGSLEKIALFPASTIQLLGAEKALFRHIKTGAKPPKFGVIINHPLVAKAKPDIKGKTARMLADKISIASKIDFFKGEFRGDKLREEVEAKFR
jgi:nucleolar protein 56